MAKKKGNHRLVIYIRAEQDQALRSLAEEKGMTISEQARRILETALEEITMPAKPGDRKR